MFLRIAGTWPTFASIVLVHLQVIALERLPEPGGETGSVWPLVAAICAGALVAGLLAYAVGRIRGGRKGQ